MPSPDHSIYAKVSHSMDTRRRSWGVASSALPGLQLTDKAWQLAPSQGSSQLRPLSSCHSNILYSIPGTWYSFELTIGCLLRSPNASHHREGENPLGSSHIFPNPEQRHSEGDLESGSQ